MTRRYGVEPAVKWKLSEGSVPKGYRIVYTVFTYLAQLERERRALRVAGLHVALQVDVEKLEHEVELLIRVDNVQQPVNEKIELGMSRLSRFPSNECSGGRTERYCRP